MPSAGHEGTQGQIEPISLIFHSIHHMSFMRKLCYLGVLPQNTWAQTPLSLTLSILLVFAVNDNIAQIELRQNYNLAQLAL